MASSNTKTASDDDQDWDSLFDDSGNTLDKNVVNELNKDLQVNSLAKQFASTKLDYNKFEKEDEDDAVTPKVECGNILEIYNFSPDMKTADLQSALSSYGVTTFDIDWVDDTHALAVYPNNETADRALGLNYVVLKLRPLSEGINKSKIKADKRFGKFCKNLIFYEILQFFIFFQQIKFPQKSVHKQQICLLEDW